MRILLIGHKVEEQFAMLMAIEWRKLGHDVTHIAHRELLKSLARQQGVTEEAWFNQYVKAKMPINLTETEYELIVVIQGILHFNFKTKAAVVYYQFERAISPSVARPTITLGSYVECDRHIRTFYPWERSTLEHYETFLECADPDLYPDRNCDKDPGVHFIMKRRAPVQELYMFNEGLKKHRKLLKSFHDDGKVIIHQEMPYEEYKAMLPKHEASFMLTQSCGNLTQRAYECLAAKSIPVILVENPRLYPFLKKWGFVHGETAWIVEEPEDVLGFYELSKTQKKRMRQAGYRLLMEKHTPAIRAQQLLDIVVETGHLIGEGDLLSYKDITGKDPEIKKPEETNDDTPKEEIKTSTKTIMSKV